MACAGDDGRAALVARWYELTRAVLPGMAARERWPIRLDHCFMRVFLDQAMGRVWDEVVRRPAVRHMAVPDLARAVDLAERTVADPARLPVLNAQSLAWRRARAAAQRRDRDDGACGGV